MWACSGGGREEKKDNEKPFPFSIGQLDEAAKMGTILGEPDWHYSFAMYSCGFHPFKRSYGKIPCKLRQSPKHMSGNCLYRSVSAGRWHVTAVLIKWFDRAGVVTRIPGASGPRLCKSASDKRCGYLMTFVAHANGQSTPEGAQLQR